MAGSPGSGVGLGLADPAGVDELVLGASRRRRSVPPRLIDGRGAGEDPRREAVRRVDPAGRSIATGLPIPSPVGERPGKGARRGASRRHPVAVCLD